MNNDQSKRFKSVSEMTQELSDDQAFADKVDDRLAARQIVRTLFAKRSAKGMSQKDVATKLECTQSRISKLEKGDDKDLRLGDLVAYADAIGLDLNLVLTKQGMTLADQVKYHAFCIKALLDKLAQLAVESGDPSIAKGVHHFFGEAKYNLGLIVQGSAGILLPASTEKPAPRVRYRVEVKEIDIDAPSDLTPCGEHP